jgi:hypothetical protein
MLVKYNSSKEIELDPGDLVKIRSIMGSVYVGIFIETQQNSRSGSGKWGEFTWLRFLIGDDYSSLNSNLIFSIEKIS